MVSIIKTNTLKQAIRFKLLIKFVLSTVLSTVFMSVYISVEGIFVARFLSFDASCLGVFYFTNVYRVSWWLDIVS